MAAPMAAPMQQQQQPQQPQQPAGQVMQVTCPPGVSPGQQVQVQGPNGQVMAVQVPAGVGPGMTFQVQVPAMGMMPPPQQQQQQQQMMMMMPLLGNLQRPLEGVWYDISTTNIRTVDWILADRVGVHLPYGCAGVQIMGSIQLVPGPDRPCYTRRN